MTTVIGLTATRMQEIEAASIVDGDVVGGSLILSKHDGTQINAGSVIGPQGPVGPSGIGIPGEIKLWPGDVLPEETEYGIWTWANGGAFNVADYPIAAANIAPAWKTAMGQSDPGAGKFRVPDLRGLVPAGLDAMPVGAARANRLTRAAAIIIATKTGEEEHVVTISEMPSHVHDFTPTAFITASGFNQDTVQAGATYPLKGSWTTPATGGDGAHENVQPTIFVPYIVKLDD